MTEGPRIAPRAFDSGTSVRLQDREDPQQVGVDPDQAHREREGGAPRLPGREAVADALLDEVEVQNQHEDTEHQAGDREEQTEAGELVEAELGAEEAEHEL